MLVGNAGGQNWVTSHVSAIGRCPSDLKSTPQVEHFYLDEASGLASELIAEHLHLPVEFVLRLMWFGAVYMSPVVPAPPASSSGWISPEMHERILSWRSTGIAKHGKDVSEAPAEAVAVECWVYSGCPDEVEVVSTLLKGLRKATMRYF